MYMYMYMYMYVYVYVYVHICVYVCIYSYIYICICICLCICTCICMFCYIYLKMYSMHTFMYTFIQCTHIPIAITSLTSTSPFGLSLNTTTATTPNQSLETTETNLKNHKDLNRNSKSRISKSDIINFVKLNQKRKLRMKPLRNSKERC